MKSKESLLETIVHGIFLILGLITVGCVLLITVYLVISGVPAIAKIGLFQFLFGTKWASTASEPSFGILPFIMTSIYGTAGAILLGVPVGFFTSVYLAKIASPKVRGVIETAVSLLAGIPSVVYGLVGMLILVPGIRKLFNVPDGASLLAAIIVLAIMILPSIIKVSLNALEAVPKEYEDASLALGATDIETYFKVSVPAARSGIAAAVVLGVGRAIGEAMAVMMVSANVKSVMTVRAAAKNGPGIKRKLYIGLMKFLMGLSITITCGLVLFMIGYVLYRGVPNISWKLVSTSPSYLDDNIGILPDILNTLYIVIATLVIVLPLGVGAAIYLTEYAANKKIVGMIEYAAETLSGIPSIIYGLVGMLFFCQFLSLQTSLLAGALTLVVMNLPTIMRTTQESLKTVPQSYREGAFGLGAGKWRVIRTVVLPGCIDGVVTGCILSVGRIIGESAALLFTAGLAHAVNGMIDGLHSAGATLTVALYMYAKEQGEFGVAFAIAAILMVLTVFINLTATLLGKYFQRRKSQ